MVVFYATASGLTSFWGCARGTFPPQASFKTKECKYPGYLRHGGSVSLMYACPNRCINRSDLISLSSVEKKREEALELLKQEQLDQQKEAAEAAKLDAAHEKNVEKTQEDNSYSVESPVATLGVTVQQPEPYSPEEFLLYINDHSGNDGKTVDNLAVPFEMPNQENPLPLPVIPSKSIYDRK